MAAIICIARAVLANTRIFILDEATASVDTVTESLIQAALDRLLSGHTAIVIAHRLSTIPNADLICVIDHGRIVEQGTHDSLLTRHGVYHRLYERQFLPPAPLQPWHSPTCITLLNGVMIKFTGLWQFCSAREICQPLRLESTSASREKVDKSTCRQSPEIQLEAFHPSPHSHKR